VIFLPERRIRRSRSDGGPLVEFDIEVIVNALNAAALDPGRWDAALEVIVKTTGSFGSIVFPLQGSMPYVPSTRSMEQSFELYVRDGWIDRDERYRGTSRLLRNGIATDRDVMPEEAQKRSAYYQDFVARCNLTDFAAVRVGTGEQVWSLTFHRSGSQERFSLKELETFRLLSVQLSSTAEIASALGMARSNAALSAFDAAGKAAVLLNRRGEVIRANERAEKLFDQHIGIVRHRLTSSNKVAREAFETALRRLLWSFDSSGVAPVSFPRPGNSPVVVYLMRSFQLADTPLSAYHAIAVLVDPDERLLPTSRTLQENFGLTPAEARLALSLQAGDDLQSAAARLNVSLETVRKQVKSVFVKAGVKRQVDLVALISNLLPDI
jgi:DNA-binding CsgD family transcriptional regulator